MFELENSGSGVGQLVASGSVHLGMSWKQGTLLFASFLGSYGPNIFNPDEFPGLSEASRLIVTTDMHLPGFVGGVRYCIARL